MGKIVIWNSEICFGHMLYCMFTVLAFLEPKALNDWSSLEGRDIKPMRPKAGEVFFCPYLSDQRANLQTLASLDTQLAGLDGRCEKVVMASTGHHHFSKEQHNTQAQSTPRKVSCDLHKWKAT